MLQHMSLIATDTRWILHCHSRAAGWENEMRNCHAFCVDSCEHLNEIESLGDINYALQRFSWPSKRLNMLLCDSENIEDCVGVRKWLKQPKDDVKWALNAIHEQMRIVFDSIRIRLASDVASNSSSALCSPHSGDIFVYLVSHRESSSTSDDGRGRKSRTRFEFVEMWKIARCA